MRKTALLFLLLASLCYAESFRLAAGSCLKPKKGEKIFDTILTTKPDAFLFLGDNHYADTTDMAKLVESYQKLTNLESYQRLRAAVPILATWDDHDYGENDAGREFIARESSQAIFLDSFQFPADHPARSRAGIYHQVFLGEGEQRVQVIILDTRYHRSELIRKRINNRKAYFPQTDPNATILGEEQWAWLEKVLKEKAALRIVATSIQAIMTDHRFEKWNNIPAERKKLFKTLQKGGNTPIVLLSGDRHLAEVCKADVDETGLPFPLYEMTTSGLNRAGSPEYPSNYRVPGTHYNKRNFGTVTADFSKEKYPQVTLRIHDVDGHIVTSTKIPFRN